MTDFHANTPPDEDLEDDFGDTSEDGRHARAERGRRQAIDAAITLLANGEPLQSIDQIADASGLSKRTLFRYFGGLDGLVDEMFAVFQPVVFQLFASPPVDAPLEDRIRGVIAIHYEFAQRFGHMARTIDRIADNVPRARDMKELREATFRRQTEAWLLSEFKKMSPAAATQVILLTSFDAVHNMYINAGDDTVDALTQTVLQVIVSN
jgi:AcrR family transcriptional regulator